jgi:molecular chaperone DnaK
MGLAVGIDLGTTNTVVGVVKDGVVSTLPDPTGARLIPSVVSFHPSGKTLVGAPAVERRLNDASNTIYSVKRLIGRPWDSPEVQQARSTLPFELREGANGATLVVARGEVYSLPEISAFVLRQARAVAEAALGEPVERAVITVPANFNDLQRAATKTAGRLAGIEVLRILNEPTAAALAYGPSGKEAERIAVYDLGGGTFDVTILDLAGNVFEVLATAGDTSLGGDDIDLVVAERMADDLLKKHRFDARAQPAIFTRLRLLAEHMKQELSAREEFTLVVDDLVPGDRGASLMWQFRMTRPELEWASLALVERTFKVCQSAIDASGGSAKDLDRIILVGGATRMPMVARKVEQFFARAPVVRINPDEVVALGAAIQAALLDRNRRTTEELMSPPRIHESSVVMDLPTEAPLGDLDLALPVVDSKGALPVAPISSPVAPPIAAPPPVPPPRPPATTQFLPGSSGKALVFDVPEPAVSPFEVELDPAPPRVRPPTRTLPGVNAEPPPVPQFAPPPMRPRQETTRFGAELSATPVAAPVAARAHISPPRPAPLLIDVTPLSLGVETVGGYCDVLIDANTPVPCDRTRTFSTATDGQTVVQLRVSQGESRRFAENTCLGQLELTGIAPGPRGSQEIGVTFEIDADGILNVRARDVATGKETAARMQLVGAQEAGDLEAMRARQAAHPLAPLGDRS